MRVSNLIAGMNIVFEPGLLLRPLTLSLPPRKAPRNPEGSVTYGQL